MDKGCQTGPSSVRTETVWAGEVTAPGMLRMRGKSRRWHNSICFYLFLPFHIPSGFGCCLLFSSSGPSFRLRKHQRHPSLAVWRCFSPSSWEHGMLLAQGLGTGVGTCGSTRGQHFIPSPGEQPCCRVLVCVWRGHHSQTHRAVQLHLAVPSA